MLKRLIVTQLRFLVFLPIRPDLKAHFRAHLLWVVGISWLVGIGRYWDHPDAHWWQYAGLGSVAYIFCLAAVLYLVVAPLNPGNWSFRLVLVFVGLTALPGLLYAIPVERFMSLEQAQHANAAFLGVVALWRVALYIKFLVTAARLHWFLVIVVSVLPLSAIVFALASLNLEHVVFDLMAGVRETDASPYDAAYGVVVGLAFLSFVAFPVAAVAWACAIVFVHERGKGGEP